MVLRKLLAAVDEEELQLCQQALLQAVAKLLCGGGGMELIHPSAADADINEDDEPPPMDADLREALGDRIVVLTGQATAYNLCFV